MTNFRKVFTIRAFSLTLCVLLLGQTIVFATPISHTLRVPISFDTNKRISRVMLAELLIDHFKAISLDSQDMIIMQSLSEEIQEEKTWGNFINDEEFRNYVLASIILGIPENMQKLWDMSDALGLSEEDITWLIDRVYKETNQSSISLPGITDKTEARLPMDFIANNIKKLGLNSFIDPQLKNLLREKLPHDLTLNTELTIRSIGPDAENTAFLIGLLRKKDCSGEVFKPALRLLLSLCKSEKKSNVEEILKARRKHEFEIISRNYRFDEMPDILSVMIGGERIGLNEKPMENRLKIPTIETGEGSFPYLSGRIAIQKAQQNIELLDYLLDLDEETVPDALNKVIFDIDRSLPPKSERIRTVRDYRDMYFKLYPVDKNEKELIGMSLAVLKKLYLLLSEEMRLLKELKSKMKDRGNTFQEIVISPRLNQISKMKYSMLEAFKKMDSLYEGKDYEGARQEALTLYAELYKAIYRNSYPTAITVDFIDLLKEKANDVAIQDVLKRLNEIDFGSCRFIEFIVSALFEEYSVLRYPYVYDFNNIFLFGKTENPWENFRRHFKEEENVDISGINRVSGDSTRKMGLIVFGETLEIMMYELLKNAVTNADYDPKTRKLKGEIRENFEDTPEGYCYTMEDNNAGIPKDRLRSVFNICVSYTRFNPDMPRYKEFAGLGIGLKKVLAIVDMYGGTLRVVSRAKGEKAYELSYEKGVFSGVYLSKKNELQYPTGTKFFITLPYPTIDLDEVLPSKDQRAEDGSLPLIKNNKTSELASNQGLKGPFRVAGTDILCYLDEIIGQDKIKETVEKWFSQKADKSFERGQWEVLTSIHPDGYLAKLETEGGKVLGIAFVRRVQNLMFFMNERTGEEDIASVYYLDRMEITDEYRNLGLGEILMAKVVEKALNDADIKDRVLVTEPATKGSHSADNFFNRIGGTPINILNEQLDQDPIDDETEWQSRHYVFYRTSSQDILNKARSRVVPTQLSLFEDRLTENLASNQAIIDKNKAIPSARGINLLLLKIEELKKVRSPLLVCISGNAGVGKSVFAKLIARRIEKSLIIKIDDFYTQVDGLFWVLNEKKAAEAINRNIKSREYDVLIVEGFEAFSVGSWLKAMNRKSFAGKRKAFDIHVRLVADDVTRYNNIKQKQDFSPPGKSEDMHDTEIWSYVQELHEGEDLKEKPDYIFDNSIDKRPTLASNERVKATGDFVPQEITDKFGNRYYIEKIDPADYFSYAKEFLRIYQEEMRLLRDSEDINGYIGIDMLNGLYSNLIGGAESEDIMAFFVLKNSLGEIIGGRIFYNPEIVPGVESEIVTGMDTIRFKYQNTGLGVRLRSIALKWLKEKGYTRYGARIFSDNERSLQNLKRVSLGLNARISTTIDPELYILEFTDTTTEKQTFSTPNFTIEAINSSL